MRLLIVGAGSIGERHARNAADMATTLIVDEDLGRARLVAKRWGGVMCRNLDEAMDRSPDAAIVATPTRHHAPVALHLLQAGCACLIEKPVSHSLEAARELAARAAAHRCRVYVACNMRFHAGPATVRTFLPRIGRPFFARADFGNWLPAMRPGVDARQLYCARRSEGGGVLFDGIHELDYLLWLFGDISTGHAEVARLGEVTVDAEDYAAAVLTHVSGTRSEIHLDYLRPLKRRGCEVVGSEGMLLWESEGKSPERCRVTLCRRDADGPERLLEDAELDPDAAYRAMLAQFLSAAAGKPSGDLLDLPTAMRELEIVLGLHEGIFLRTPSRQGDG